MCEEYIEVLQELNSHANNDQVRFYLDDHRNSFKWAGLGVLAVEFLTFCASLCCAGTVSGLDDEMLSGTSGYMAMSDVNGGALLVSSGGDFTGGQISATPVTDRRRAELNQKYGGLFETRQQQFSTNATAIV